MSLDRRSAGENWTSVHLHCTSKQPMAATAATPFARRIPLLPALLLVSSVLVRSSAASASPSEARSLLSPRQLGSWPTNGVKQGGCCACPDAADCYRFTSSCGYSSKLQCCDGSKTRNGMSLCNGATKVDTDTGTDTKTPVTEENAAWVQDGCDATGALYYCATDADHRVVGQYREDTGVDANARTVRKYERCTGVGTDSQTSIERIDSSSYYGHQWRMHWGPTSFYKDDDRSQSAFPPVTGWK